MVLPTGHRDSQCSTMGYPVESFYAHDDPRYNQYLLSLHRAETITNLSHSLFSVVTVQIAARDRRTRMCIPGRRRHA